jgi:membrane protease YdiL (CAAX protease family)
MLSEGEPSGIPAGEPGPASPAGPPEAAIRPARRRLGRLTALMEVVLCSGFPTQLALASLASLAGFSPFGANGGLVFGYVGMLLLADSAVVVALVVWLLRVHGERPRDVLLGARPLGGEALLSLPLTVLVFGVVFALLRTMQTLTPWLHNVTQNPLEQLVKSPSDAALFAVVATAAGGLREEIQRAFILHRFTHWLGGPWLGLVLFSAAFGAGHALQGWDAAITTAALGALWGLVYLVRGSIAAPVISHSIFNSAEIVRVVALGG